MKVVCVSHQIYRDTEIPFRDTDPQIGDECIVSDTLTIYSSVLVYRLVGYFMLYDVRNFAPVSSIDETEFERNYNKELV